MHANDVRYHAPSLPEGIDPAHMAELLDRADEAFWAVVADGYPEVTSGDYAPEQVAKRDQDNIAAVQGWLLWNHPAYRTPEDDVPTAALT